MREWGAGGWGTQVGCVCVVFAGSLLLNAMRCRLAGVDGGGLHVLRVVQALQSVS